MGRIRLGAGLLTIFGLLLPLAREAGAQSASRTVKPNEEKEGPSVDARRHGHPPQPRPRGPEIFYCETPETSCRTTQDTFSIAELRDLYVFVVWPGVAGQHAQTVEFLLPDGSMYSTKKTRFLIGGVTTVAATGAAPKNEVSPVPPADHLIADGNRIHQEGIPSLLTKSRGDASVLTVLPVGGTYITQRNLSGTWRVRVLLDDRLALESEFTLIPRPAPAKTEAGAER
jgi:hypothetical protein